MKKGLRRTRPNKCSYITCVRVRLVLIDSALPKPPDRVIATELTSTSVKLIWSSTDDDGDGGGSSSPSYVVQYVDKSTAAAAAAAADREPAAAGHGDEVREVVDIGATEYTVTGLRAHTPYEFRVIAANGLGRGTPSSPILVTTAEHGQTSILIFIRHEL